MRWNQMPYLFRFGSWEKSPFSEEEYNNLLNHPYIIHYSTREKPWHNNCNHPQKKLFYEYVDNSIWSNWYVEQAMQKRRQEKMAVFHNMFNSLKKRIKSLPS